MQPKEHINSVHNSIPHLDEVAALSDSSVKLGVKLAGDVLFQAGLQALLEVGACNLCKLLVHLQDTHEKRIVIGVLGWGSGGECDGT